MAQNTPPPHRPSTVTVKGREMRLRTIGVAVLSVLAVWFIAVNTGSVSITLWVADVTLPLWVVLAVTLATGLAIGFFLGRRSRVKG
ncbi:LapA family protein [Kitasatospora sp. NBC_01560]|uniref:LapA family protein n=1 Tax=Kitasatospora sp. NBC_01560 TaxID=2975965 RepID=UPI0038700884